MKTALRLLRKPLASLDQYCKRKTPEYLSETARDLDAIAVQAARMAAYLEMRSGHGCGDKWHEAAVREQNKTAATVRKALGYTYPKADINF